MARASGPLGRPLVALRAPLPRSHSLVARLCGSESRSAGLVPFPASAVSLVRAPGKSQPKSRLYFTSFLPSSPRHVTQYKLLIQSIFVQITATRPWIGGVQYDWALKHSGVNSSTGNSEQRANGAKKNTKQSQFRATRGESMGYSSGSGAAERPARQDATDRSAGSRSTFA